MKLNLARTMIAVVLLVNVWCALVFLLRPGDYAGGFELSGALGEAMLRALGVLFLMWNVPYAVALWHPVRHRVSLLEALAMQAIGLVGESFIYQSLPVIHSLTRSSLRRFIVFDFLGLLFLVGAVWLTRKPPLLSQE
jgi:hypothetical protein